MKKKTLGFYLVALSTVLALICLVLYKNTLVKTSMVNTLLILAVVVGACAVLTAFAIGKEFTNFLAVVHAVLLIAAIGMSIAPMVNDIGLAYAGLNQWTSIYGYFTFVGVACAAWLLGLIASFIGLVKKS